MRIIRIIVSRTPAIHMCTEWIWKAPLLSEVPNRPTILIIYAITSYDEQSIDAVVVDGSECLPNKRIAYWSKQPCMNFAYPDSKVHGAIMRPIWGRQDTCRPHVGPMNFAIWVLIPSVLKSIEISLIIVESRKRSKYGQGTLETMTGCIKQLQACNAVKQNIP